MKMYDQTNALQVQNHIITKPRLGKLARFRRLADVLIRGPNSVNIRRKTIDDYENFDLLIRIIIRTKDLVTSCAVYRQGVNWQRQSPEHIPGCVLRFATWDVRAAIDAQEWEREDAPHLTTTTLYVVDEYCNSVEHDCKYLDSILLPGVPLVQRSNIGQPEWNTIEILRQFDMARIELLWDWSVQNLSCETAVFALAKTIQETLRIHESQELHKIEAMEMVYYEPSEEAIEILSKEDKT